MSPAHVFIGPFLIIAMHTSMLHETRYTRMEREHGMLTHQRLMNDYNIKNLLLVTLLVVISVSCDMKKIEPPKHQVDFSNIYTYAVKAKDAYASEEEIQKKYPESLLQFRSLHNSQVQYFILEEKENKELLISIRGTANMANTLKDAEYTKSQDRKLTLFFHKGFNEAADELYEDIQPFISPFKTSYTVNITGHSLGGAIAAILMAHLQADQYTIGSVMTFGQPKVTNEAGVQQTDHSPLLRIIHHDDLVPLVPPRSLLSAIHGTYRHMGREIILIQDENFIYLDDAPAEQADVTGFWHNIGHQSLDDHFMDNYLANIQSKVTNQKEVAYSDKRR